MTSWMRRKCALGLSGLALFVGGLGCGDDAAAALGTSVGRPLLLGLEQGSELQVGSLESSPLRVRLDTVSGDATHHTRWSVRSGMCLEITPRSGASILVYGAPITADYYHLGRVLMVSVGDPAQPELASFIEPVAYRTVVCPPGQGLGPVAPPPARASNE